MTKNVHILPTHKTASRRRVRPVPGLPLADVMPFETRDMLTSQEQLAECRAAMDEALDEAANGLLITIRALKVIRRLEGALSHD